MTDLFTHAGWRAFLTVGISVAFFGLYLVLQGTFSAYWYDLSLEEVNRHRKEEYKGFIFMIALLLVPSLLWHATDLFGLNRTNRVDQSLVGSYKPVLTLLLYGLLGGALIAAGVMEVVDCWPPAPSPSETGFQEFGYFCTPDPTSGIIPLVLLPAVLLLVIALAKAALTIKVSIKKTS